MGGEVRVHKAEALFVPHRAACGSHESPMNEGVPTKKSVHDVAGVGQTKASCEIDFKQLLFGIPRNSEGIVLAGFNVGLRFVGLHRPLHIVHDGTIAGQGDVVVPRITHIGVLPRVHFHSQRGVEGAVFIPNGAPRAPNDEVARAKRLQDEHHAVCPIGIGGPKIHRELKVGIRFKVELATVPSAPTLVLGCWGQPNTPICEELCPLDQFPLRQGGDRKTQPETEKQKEKYAHQEETKVWSTPASSVAMECLSKSFLKDCAGAGVGFFSQA